MVLQNCQEFSREDDAALAAIGLYICFFENHSCQVRHENVHAISWLFGKIFCHLDFSYRVQLTCLLWNFDVCAVWTRWCFSMWHMSLQGPSSLQTWREGAVKIENSCKISWFLVLFFNLVSLGYLTLNECTGYSSWELPCGWHLRGWKGTCPCCLKPSKLHEYQDQWVKSLSRIIDEIPSI